MIYSSRKLEVSSDQLNGILIHDIKTMKRMARHRPHLYALDLNNPRALSGFMALPAPVVSNIATWVHGDT